MLRVGAITLMPHLLLCWLATCLLGCDEAAPVSKPVLAAPKQAYQRFVPLEGNPLHMVGVPWQGFFALDTKTGMLCQTVGMEFTGDAKWAGEIPTCEAAAAAHPE